MLCSKFIMKELALNIVIKKIQNDCQLNNVCRRDKHQPLFQVFNKMEKTKMKREQLKGLGGAQATFSFPSMKHICVFLWLFFRLK